MKTAGVRILLLLSLLMGGAVVTVAQAGMCEVERSAPLDGRSNSAPVTHIFNDLDPGAGIELVGLANVDCAREFSLFPFGWVCIDGDNPEYQITENRITLTSRHSATFTVSGQQVDCGDDPDPEPGSLSLASIPLDAGVFVPPNILLIMDNSNSMVEGVDGLVASTHRNGGSGYCQPWAGGVCDVGASSPLSKSEITRGVGRRLVQNYRDQINLGLMAYQQNPASSSSSGWDNNIIRGWIVNRLYDVTYNPSNYDASSDCSFNLTNWDSTDRCNRTANPSHAGQFIYYNIGVPGYSSGASAPDQVQHCRTRDPDGGYTDAPFRFRCYRTKTGSSDQNNTYSNLIGDTSGQLNDSARARGVTHWGERMAALSFGEREWITVSSPGLGYLHTPIRPLDEDQAEALLTKLGPVTYDFTSGMETAADQPLINAGLTPLEGTLLTARDYFSGQTQYFNNAQGRRNADDSLPNSCGVNAAVWLTDGMPSVSKSGSPYGEDIEEALNKAIESAESFHETTGAQLFVVGFAMPPTAEQDALNRLAQAGGSERSFLATDPTGLDEAITSIFDQVIEESRQTATSAAFSSARLRSDTSVISAGYRTEDWSGELRARDVNTGNTLWNAETQLKAHRSNLDLFTYNRIDNKGVSLKSSEISKEAFDALNLNREGEIDGKAFDRINWLRWQNVEGLRSRTVGNQERLLGSIIHSNPFYWRARNYAGYDRLPDKKEADGYMGYLNDQQGEYIYVGSNDGRVYAFDAKKGRPLFAYMPSEFIYPGELGVAPISRLMRDDYRDAHRFFVNGDVQVGDAYINNSWTTVLVGTLNQGGRRVFALDVNNPENFSTSDVLWEFTHKSLGYGVEGVSIARLKNGQWAAVFGNGYNAPSGKSGLFIVDLETGDLIRFIEVGSSSDTDNGLARPRLIHWEDRNYVSTYAYAGDLKGRLWRFNLNSRSSSNWKAEKLFEGNPDQRITAQPRIVVHPERNDRAIVLFGTGSFKFIDDAESAQIQSFYAIFDDLSQTGVSRSDLLQQEITAQGTVEHEGETFTLRSTSREDIRPGNQGWYIDLDYQDGERIISSASLSSKGDRVRFNTLAVVRSQDQCVPPRREGFLFELSLSTGSNLADTKFVVNPDSPKDLAEEFENISAIAHDQGQASPAIISALSSEMLMRDVFCEDEDCEAKPAGIEIQGRPTGRLHWEQIR